MPIYKIKKKLWSWGEDVKITTAEDESIFYIVKGEIDVEDIINRYGNKFMMARFIIKTNIKNRIIRKLCNIRALIETATTDEEKRVLEDAMKLEVANLETLNENRFFTRQVEKRFHFLKRNRDGRVDHHMEVRGSNDEQYFIDYAPFFDKYTFKRNGKAGNVAKVSSNKWFPWRDSHVVRIDEGEDVGAILACCLVIDHWRGHHIGHRVSIGTGAPQTRPSLNFEAAILPAAAGIAGAQSRELPNDALDIIMEFCGPEQFIMLGLVNRQFCQAYGTKFGTETSMKIVVHSMQALQWARENGCPWNEQFYIAMMAGGHFEMLEWARKNGCPWNETNVRAIIRFKDFEQLQQQTQTGRPLGVVEKRCLQVLTTWCWFHDKDFEDFEREVYWEDL